LANATVSLLSFLKKLAFLFLLLHLTGCGFQSRKYTTGHFWDGRNEIVYETEKQSEKQSGKQSEKQSGKQNERQSGKQSEKQSEKKPKACELGNRESDAMSKDTPLEKWENKKRAEWIAKPAEEDSLNKEKDPIESEKKIRRSTNGFLTFWSIESLFYLGLLYNTYSPDVWGFFLVIFGFFTVLLLIPTLIYLRVMNARYHRSKESIQDEKIKKRSPKWSRIFAKVILAELIMLLLALVLGGNF
jgi:hypothetical protein